jgi:hypothetical protein
MLALRERLVSARSIEAGYLALVRERAAVPPLFRDQQVHLILRNALDGCDDPYVLRAAELFFRPQRAASRDGALLLADAELVEGAEAARGPSPLAAMLGEDPATSLDILADDNAWTYWSRSDAFSMALNLGTNPRSREGIARVIETFVRHLLGIAVAVSPVTRLTDPDWRWFVGLDAEATRIGNDLWAGEAITAQRAERILALFRMHLPPEVAVEPRAAGHPIYLILAMDAERRVRVKPQNLIVGLPLAGAARAA